MKRPEYVAYESGYQDAERAARITAFGAIRRAAEVARECDAIGDIQTVVGLQWKWWNHAKCVRKAIRAAIELEKA